MSVQTICTQTTSASSPTGGGLGSKEYETSPSAPAGIGSEVNVPGAGELTSSGRSKLGANR